MSSNTGRLRQEGEHVIHATMTNPVTEKLIRLGYLVRGLVYGVIGLLALRVAAGSGGALADQQGAIAAVGGMPAGRALLIAVLAGLLGYALWSMVRAVFDPLHRGHGVKGIAQRLGHLASALSYGVLARATYWLIVSGASAAGAGNLQTRQTTASILSRSWGPWAIGIAAAVIIGAGLLDVFRGLRRHFNRQYELAGRPGSMHHWISRIGRFGTIINGVVFILAGGFLFLAAYHHDASRAQGIDGVLKAVLHEPFGQWLLGIVAVGFIAFGIYSAMVRRVIET